MKTKNQLIAMDVVKLQHPPGRISMLFGMLGIWLPGGPWKNTKSNQIHDTYISHKTLIVLIATAFDLLNHLIQMQWDFLSVGRIGNWQYFICNLFYAPNTISDRTMNEQIITNEADRIRWLDHSVYQKSYIELNLIG